MAELSGVPVIGATTATEDRELRDLGAEVSKVRCELDRVSGIELVGFVELARELR
ncbi:MAG: hypothetical protein ACHQAV_04610 [Solirubrobacterales bacterium]